MGSESGKQAGAVEKRPPGSKACPVTTRRDGQIIIETSWGQEIGFPFQSGDGENLQCPITTDSHPLIGPWPVLKRTALTALVEENRCQCCAIKKDSLCLRKRDDCPILVIPDISWDTVEELHMGPAVICLIYMTTEELHFDVFWSHTGWFIVNIRCKNLKSAGKAVEMVSKQSCNVLS